MEKSECNRQIVCDDLSAALSVIHTGQVWRPVNYLGIQGLSNNCYLANSQKLQIS